MFSRFWNGLDKHVLFFNLMGFGLVWMFWGSSLRGFWNVLDGLKEVRVFFKKSLKTFLKVEGSERLMHSCCMLFEC